MYTGKLRGNGVLIAGEDRVRGNARLMGEVALIQRPVEVRDQGACGKLQGVWTRLR